LKCAALAGAILALLFAGGCGGSGESGSTASSAEPATIATTPESDAISQSEIDKYKPGEPAHTVLAWWRLVQVNDPETAQPLYVEEPSLPDLAGQFNYVSADLAGKVKVVSTDESGGTATVKVRWDRADGGPVDETLELEEVGPNWKLLATRFVDEIVQEKQEAEG
jgi:hypothetical protein